MVHKIRLITTEGKSRGLLEWDRNEETPEVIIWGCRAFIKDGWVDYHLGGAMDGERVSDKEMGEINRIHDHPLSVPITRVYEYYEKANVINFLAPYFHNDTLSEAE